MDLEAAAHRHRHTGALTCLTYWFGARAAFLASFTELFCGGALAAVFFAPNIAFQLLAVASAILAMPSTAALVAPETASITSGSMSFLGRWLELDGGAEELPPRASEPPRKLEGASRPEDAAEGGRPSTCGERAPW